MKVREITFTKGEMGTIKRLLSEHDKVDSDEGTLSYNTSRIQWDKDKITLRFLDGTQFKKDYPLPTKGDYPGP